MADTGAGVEIREDRDGFYFLVEQDGFRARRIVHMKKAEHGYRGFVPSMPDLSVQGETREEVQAALTQGINERLGAMRG